MLFFSFHICSLIDHVISECWIRYNWADLFWIWTMTWTRPVVGEAMLNYTRAYPHPNSFLKYPFCTLPIILHVHCQHWVTWYIWTTNICLDCNIRKLAKPLEAHRICMKTCRLKSIEQAMEIKISTKGFESSFPDKDWNLKGTLQGNWRTDGNCPQKRGKEEQIKVEMWLQTYQFQYICDWITKQLPQDDANVGGGLQPQRTSGAVWVVGKWRRLGAFPGDKEYMLLGGVIRGVNEPPAHPTYHLPPIGYSLRNGRA